MKEIGLKQAENIMVGNTQAYYTPEQVNYFMGGYNSAVKKHNAKREKKNQTTTINVPESDMQVVFKRLAEVESRLNAQEYQISRLFEKIEELKK